MSEEHLLSLEFHEIASITKFAKPENSHAILPVTHDSCTKMPNPKPYSSNHLPTLLSVPTQQQIVRCSYESEGHSLSSMTSSYDNEPKVQGWIELFAAAGKTILRLCDPAKVPNLMLANSSDLTWARETASQMIRPDFGLIGRDIHQNGQPLAPEDIEGLLAPIIGVPATVDSKNFFII